MKMQLKKFLKLMKEKFFWIVVVSLSIVLMSGLLVYNLYNDITSAPEEDKKVDESSLVLEQYNDFILYSDTTQYQQDLFKTLVDTPIDEPIDNYIDIYSKNFIADFLTLSSKDVNLRRIGGRRYIHLELQDRYVESSGVIDYYNVRDYLVYNNSDFDTSTLPEITSIDLVSIDPITYDFKDLKHTIPERLGLSGYSVKYDLTYLNTNMQQFNYYTSATVKVVNWDGVWTVVETEFI